MAEKQNIPEIRFEGFTDPWEQRKLNEYLETSREKNESCHFGKDDVLSVSGDYGIVNQIEFQGRSYAGTSVANYGVVHKGDVVYTKSPLRINPYGIIKTNRGNDGIVSTLYAVYHPTEKTHPDFVQVYFEQNARMNNYMAPLVSKGAKNDMKVSAENALKGAVTFPGIKEQEVIASYFSQLDDLITLHQRKYDKLCTVKKSMLDKMFPKPGETEPEIRFEGFTDPWEQRKLGELYSLVSEKNDLTFGRESIISVANMYFNANVNVTDEQYLRTYNVMRLGDIAFEGHSNKEFSHGRFVENYIGDGIVSHIFTVLRPRVPFDVNYWRYAINNEKLMRLSLIRSTKASTMMHDLVPSDFLREAIPTPTLAEQKEIGAFLVGLDHLITLHQRKLELLRNIKKSLLDRMFV